MVLSLLLAFLLAAQDKPPEKCTLSGSVVSAASGQPLNRVEIFAEPVDDGAPATTLTDAKGNFTLVDLVPGQYKLKGRRNGYLNTYYGARRPDSGGTTITLEAGTALKDIQIKLLSFAVLAGTVRETDGEPLVGAKVAVFSLMYDSGRRAIRQVDETHTDDLGQYRIANLPPGKYYIQASPHRDDESVGPETFAEDHAPKASPREVLVPALYPGATDPRAARAVEAAAGARITGLDIALPRSRVYRITGRAAVPAGTNSDVSLGAPRGFEALGQTYPGVEKPDGDFEIVSVPPGSYMLNASAFPAGKGQTVTLSASSSQLFITALGGGDGAFLFPHNGLHASMPLEVGNTDLIGIRIAVTQGAEIDGSIKVEGDDNMKLTGAEVQFDTGAGGDAGSSTAQVKDDNTFTTQVSQGHFDVSLGSNKGKSMAIKSIRAGSVDVLRNGLTVSESGKTPLEIVLTSDGGQIDGVAFDKDEKPVAGATVLLVPEPGLRGRVDRFDDCATDQNGRYKFENVAPGDYKIFVWDDIEPGAWFDPDFFRDIEAHGEAVKLDAKGQQTVRVHLPEPK